MHLWQCSQQRAGWAFCWILCPALITDYFPSPGYSLPLATQLTKILRRDKRGKMMSLSPPCLSYRFRPWVYWTLCTQSQNAQISVLLIWTSIFRPWTRIYFSLNSFFTFQGRLLGKKKSSITPLLPPKKKKNGLSFKGSQSFWIGLLELLLQESLERSRQVCSSAAAPLSCEIKQEGGWERADTRISQTLKTHWLTPVMERHQKFTLKTHVGEGTKCSWYFSMLYTKLGRQTSWGSLWVNCAGPAPCQGNDPVPHLCCLAAPQHGSSVGNAQGTAEEILGSTASRAKSNHPAWEMETFRYFAWQLILAPLLAKLFL